jgi:hypothetical protein
MLESYSSSSNPIEQYIPIDKSWEIRRVLYLMLQGEIKAEELRELLKQPKLSNDIQALYNCAITWITEDTEFHVGESGTLYRFLRYLTWQKWKPVNFIKEWSLAHRTMIDDPSIVGLSQAKLLELDNGTSQWASAAALWWYRTRLDNPPYKLGVTYALIGQAWEDIANILDPKKDETIERQVFAFGKYLSGWNMDFLPEQAEDYLFARAFELMDTEEWRKRWPALKTHESDRLEGFELEIARVHNWEIVQANDHRVVQALAMRYGLRRDWFVYPDAVNKSWPQFWDFMEYMNKNKK